MVENSLKPAGWDDPDCWEVVERYEPDNLGVQNMTHEEIVVSLLDDLLVLHFTGWTWGIPWYDLFRFISTPRQVDRVLEALCDPVVQELIIAYKDRSDIIRLKADRASLQKVMDIAGRYYKGFQIPEGVVIVSLTPKGEQLLEDLGPDVMARLIVAKLAKESPS